MKAILEALKDTSSFECIIKDSCMLCYNDRLKPVAHYEVVDNTVFVVQIHMSYTFIEHFSKFRVDDYNKANGTSYEFVFEYAY